MKRRLWMAVMALSVPLGAALGAPIRVHDRAAAMRAMRRLAGIVGGHPLLFLCLTAGVVRLAWLYLFTGTIDSEGAEYARIAENLLAGKGYVGMTAPGTELMFPPLFPWLIAAVSFILPQAELAGRIVSLTMGTLLVLTVYGVARQLYERKTALIAAALTAFHPLLVNLSATVYCESTYLTLLTAGVYFAQRSLRSAGWYSFALAGSLFGLAYLTRPEAILYPVLTCLVVGGLAILADRRRRRQAAAQSAVLTAAFLVFAAPYVLWLSAETGQFRLAGKDALNYALSERALAGENPLKTAYGIDSNLNEEGVWMRPNAAVIKATHYRFAELLHVSLSNAKHNIPAVIAGVSSGSFLGSPLLFGLAVLGLFRRPWRPGAIGDQLLLVMIIGVTCLSVAGIAYLSSRFYFVLLPVLIVWAARGLVEVSDWSRATLRLMRTDSQRMKRISTAIEIGAAVALLLTAWRGVGFVEPFQSFDAHTRPVRIAGEWLDQFMPGPKTVIETYAVLAFHAHADYVHFPYADSSTALRYIQEKHVDFIVIEDAWLFEIPYLRGWIDFGIPDRRAELIYSVRTPGLGRVVIYRWRGNEIAAASPAPVPQRTKRLAGDGDQLTPRRIMPAGGPLKVDPANPRYFTDGSGRAIYLTGSHTWSNFQDAARIEPADSFAFDAYLDFLVQHNLNFFRLWVWEQADWGSGRPYDWRIGPLPYLRTGPGTALDGRPRFDLTRFDQSYFDRLRSRVAAAGAKGIYVSVMLFNGFSIEKKDPDWENPWLGHPYQRDNNVNGVDGDPDHQDSGLSSRRLRDPSVLQYQDEYVRKVVDTVNDLDNVLFEICNECDRGSTAWQYHMIGLIKAYEATKTKQHPVGMTVSWPGGKNSDVFASPADWISPNREGGYDESPPAPHGRQVILSDTDHIWGKGGDRGWVWKTFLRGLNPIFMDSYDQSSAYPPDIAAVRPRREDIRRNMGYTLTYANRVELSRMAPHGELASSGYCLADPTGAHPAFLVYLPSGTGNVDLRGVTADFAGEWLDPKTGVVTKTGLTGGGAVRSFKAPSAGDAVLYLAAHPDAP